MSNGYDTGSALEDIFHFNPEWTGDTTTVNQNISSSILDSIQIDPSIVDSVIKEINSKLDVGVQITDWADDFKYTTDQSGETVYTENYANFLGGISTIYGQVIGDDYLKNKDKITTILANDTNVSNLIAKKNSISTRTSSLKFKNKAISFNFSDSIFNNIVGLQITNQNAPQLYEDGYSIGIRSKDNPTFVFLKNGEPFPVQWNYTQPGDAESTGTDKYSTADLYSTGGGGYLINKNKATGMNQTIQKPGLGAIDYLPDQFNPEYGNQYTYDMMHIHHYKNEDGDYTNNSFTARFGTEQNWFDVGEMIMKVKTSLGHFNNEPIIPMSYENDPNFDPGNFDPDGFFHGDALMKSGHLVYDESAPMNARWTNTITGERGRKRDLEQSFNLSFSSPSLDPPDANYSLPTFVEFADYYLSDLKDTSGVHIFSSNSGIFKTDWTIGDVEAAENKINAFIQKMVAENKSLTNVLYENLESDTPGWEGGDIGWAMSGPLLGLTEGAPGDEGYVSPTLGVAGSEDIYGQPAIHETIIPGGQGYYHTGDRRDWKYITSAEGLDLEKNNLIRPWTDDWNWHITSGKDLDYDIPGFGTGSDDPDNTSSYGMVASLRNSNRDPGDPLDLFNYGMFYRQRVMKGNLSSREKTVYNNYQKIVQNSKLMHEYEKGLMIISWILNGRGFAGDGENFTYIHEGYGSGSGTEYSTYKDTTHLGSLPSMMGGVPDWGEHGSDVNPYMGTGYDRVSNSNIRNFQVGQFHGLKNIDVTGNRYYDNPYKEGYNFTSPIWYHGLPWSSDVHPDQKQNFSIALGLAESYKGDAGHLRGNLLIPLRDQISNKEGVLGGSTDKVYFSGVYNYNYKHQKDLNELNHQSNVIDNQLRDYLTDNYSDIMFGDVNLADLLTKDENALRESMLSHLDSYLETTLDSIGNDLYKTKAFNKVAEDLRKQINKGNYNIFIDDEAK